MIEKESTHRLVSCIMPTYNRRAFVPDAITYFLQQDYDNKELVIVDDGTDCIEDLVPIHPQIRYIRIKKSMTYAAMHNEVFHLWWHPHNFGINRKENVQNLLTLIEHFQYLKEKNGMRSATMHEIVSTHANESTV